MFGFFKQKTTTDEVSSSLYLLIKENLVKDDIRDGENIVLITKQKQRLIYLSRFYDFLEKKGLDTIKMRLVVYWTTDNYEIENDNDLAEKTIITLGSIQKINELFDTSSSQEEFTSRWLNTNMFGKDFDLSQRTLITACCIEHSKAATDVLISAFKKFKIVD